MMKKTHRLSVATLTLGSKGNGCGRDSVFKEGCPYLFKRRLSSWSLTPRHSVEEIRVIALQGPGSR